jgi:phosphoribosylformylglycinamidine (FGAM) synthase PurS component
VTIEVAIDSIVPDNTAYTALVTLRRLGYTDLAHVERSEILTLDVDGRPGAAPAIVKQISHAEVIFNPNKHRLSFSDRSVPSERSELGEWEALVSDRDDDTSGLVRLLQGPFGIAALRSLKRGVAWRLHDSSGPAPQARVEWACRELLANPYSQTAVVRRVPARDVAPRS